MNEYQKYWMLIANPKKWFSFDSRKVGEEIEAYPLKLKTKKGFKFKSNAKSISQIPIGTKVFGYHATECEVVCICELTKNNFPENLIFTKIKELNPRIKLSQLQKSDPSVVLSNGRLQSSFCKLTQQQFDFLNEPYKDSSETTITHAENDTLFISDDQLSRIRSQLKRKLNIILQGPPGVGKTFVAKSIAKQLICSKPHANIREQLLEVQFHQSYAYEDFICGYRPTNKGFEPITGVFYQFCERASNHPEHDYFIIIDEINRGNISRIFGEAFTLIENSYRGISIKLPINVPYFNIPKNLYIIGTMNTADRSLAILDYALRRRFSFFTLEPEFDSIKFQQYLNNLSYEVGTKDSLFQLIHAIKSLNKIITEDPSLKKGFCIGHSYFSKFDTQKIKTDDLKEIIEYEIAPQLREYWFDNTERAENEIIKLFTSLKISH